MLKASVSNEGRMNVLLWYRLVGTYVGLLPVLGVSGCAWYGGDSPHLAVGFFCAHYSMLCRLVSVPSPVWLALRWQLWPGCGVGSAPGQRGEMQPGRWWVKREDAISEQARLV